MRLFALGLLMMILGHGTGAAARPTPIVITDNLTLFNDTASLERLNDSDNILSFDQVASGRFAAKFKPVGQRSLHQLKGVQWYQGTLSNPTDHDIPVYLQFDLFTHIEMGLFSSSNHLLRSIQEAGWRKAFAARSIKFLQPTFEVVVPPGLSKLVIRSEGTVFTLEIGSKEAVTEFSTNFEMIFLFILGTFISLGLSNLFIYSRTLDKAYLYYFFRCIVIGLVGGVTYGFIPKHFIPNLAYNHLTVSLCLAGLDSFIWLFITRKFLSLDSFLPRRTVLGSIGFLATGLTAGVIYQLAFPSSEPCLLLRVFHPMAFAWMIGVGIFMCFKRYRPAYFYMPATTVYFVGVFVMILTVEGVITANPFLYLAPSLGGALEGLFMSFGLGDKYMNYMKAANEALSEKNLELDKELYVMLQNLDQGIFSVNQKGEISTGHSKHLRVILDKDELAGKNAFEIIFKGTEMSEERIAQIKNASLLGIEEDGVFFEMNNHLLPREIVRQQEGRQQILEMDWQPLLKDEGTCFKLMIVLRDVSDVRTLQNTNEKNQRELQIVGHVLAINLINFDKFSKNMANLTQEYQKVVAQSSTQNIPRLFRKVHTIKGNARTFGLLFIADEAHRVEDYLTELKLDPTRIPDPERMIADIKRLEAVHDEYNAVIAKLLKPTVVDAKDDLIGILNTLHRESKNVAEVKSRFLAIAELRRLERFYPTLEEMLSPIVRDQSNTAANLSKPIPNFIFNGQTMRLDSEIETFLRDIFTQILRNSVDHGIEAPLDRTADGKDKTGSVTIFIEASVNCDELIIEVQDDGAGLNLKELAKHAANPNMSDEEIAKAIFQTGVSTAKKITQISGRGVGMDIVQEEVLKRGGSVSIEFTKPKTLSGRRPFKLVFTFPSTYVLTDKPEGLHIAS